MFKFKDPLKFSREILAFQQNLKTFIPPKIIDKNLILGTWNIRSFGDYPRLEESFAYMTEIISCYDILAIQELKSSLEPLDKLKKYLGGHWQYVVSHPCMNLKGNYERMAFLYDTRRVQFSGVSSFIAHYGPKGQITLDQFSRAPFMAGFQSGSFKFFLCNVHFYADKGKVKSEFRRKEIKYLLENFQKTHWRKKYGFCDNFIILGDFNIPTESSTSYKEVKKYNFVGFDNFLSEKKIQRKFYNQILYSCNDPYLNHAESGCINIFDFVFKNEQESFYERYVKETKMTYAQWRTYQLSDHDPLWVNVPLETKRAYCFAESPERKEEHNLSMRKEGQKTDQKNVKKDLFLSQKPQESKNLDPIDQKRFQCHRKFCLSFKGL